MRFRIYSRAVAMFIASLVGRTRPARRKRISCVVIPTPMPLGQQSRRFDDLDWLNEIKTRRLQSVGTDRPRKLLVCVPQKKHKFHGFRELAGALVREVNAEVAVLDGKLAVPDQTGRTVFAAMIKHRQQARF